MPSISENEDLKKEYYYSSERELETNRPLVMGVQGPYEIINLNEKTVIISTGLKETYINKKLDTIHGMKLKLLNVNNFYLPFDKFDVETFLNTVMGINVNDAESVLNFYNNYGPLGSDKIETKSEELFNETNKKVGFHANTICEEWDFFFKEIKLLQNLIQIYEAVKNNDEDFLRNFKSKSLSTLSKEKLFTTAKKTIVDCINEHSHLINSTVELVNGDFIKLTTSTCLLGVFYIRLQELVTENTKIDKCKYCGDYFKPRKAKSNFCPPPEANEKSKCLSRYEAMTRRIAEWHFQKGLTVEEIQEKITKPKSRSKAEIQYIIDNYKGKLKK